jgi:uncharacterized protein (TIGR03084 family)
MDPVVDALLAEKDELAALLRDLDDSDWEAPTRCDGWDVSDVVLHLAQSDEMAVASATGGFALIVEERGEAWSRAGSVDDAVATMVDRERGLSGAELLERWTFSAAALIEALDTMDLSTRVPWVAGELSSRTLAATRISETWIHRTDVADAVGVEVPPTDRLWYVARLAWRTLPYAFMASGKTMKGPVAFHLNSPAGEPWDFAPEGEVETTITGLATDLCNVAARRVDPSGTSLRGEGPDVDDVLDLVRTYA